MSSNGFRGGPRTRGGSARGRGRGARSDYSTVALDYDGASSSSAVIASSSSFSSFQPASTSARRGGAAVSRSSYVPRASHSSSFSRARPSPSTSGAATPSAHHHGIGSSSLPSTRLENADLLRPVAFVKASTSLASTIGEPELVVLPLPGPHTPSSSSSSAGPKRTSDDAILLPLPAPAAALQPSKLDPTPATSSPFAPIEPRITTSHTPDSAALHLGQTLQDVLDDLEATPAAVLLTASGSSPSASLQETPNDHLFFIDTTSSGGPQAHLTNSQKPLVPSSAIGIGSVDDDDLSDTEEVYRPPIKVTERDAKPMDSRRSSRSYTVVLDDPVSDPLVLPPVIAAPGSAEMMLLRDLTETSTSRKTSNLSRMAQKKKNKREARERKKLRKKGHLTAKLFEEMELASGDDVDCKRLEVGIDSDLATHPRPRKVKGTGKSRRSRADEALQDYISNIQADGSQSDAESGLSFLQSTAFEHLNSNDLSDIAAIRDELTSSEEDHVDGEEEEIDMAILDMLVQDGLSSDSEASETLAHQEIQIFSNTGTDPRNMDNLEQGSDQEDRSSSLDSDDDDDDDEMEEAIMGYEESLMDGVLFSYNPHTRMQSVKATQFNFDAFDESLQKQWQNDRAKKALKRQERYLKRLEAQPTKFNRKKAKRAGAPEASMSSFAKSGSSESAEPGFHRLNDRIRNFIEAGALAQLALPPMDKKFRYAVHMLADTYSLKSKSRGTGKDRHNVLYRTMNTSVRGANTNKVQRYLTTTATWNIRSQNSKQTDFKGPSRSSAAPRNNEGTLVGAGADRIASDNIGHQMLAKMGWAAGEQIGRGGGLAEPISAIVKTNKAGLGSGCVRYIRGNAD